MLLNSKPSDFNPSLEAVSCAVIVGQECLFLQRAEGKSEPHHWGFPTGKVESGEDLLDAMVRELLEETGIATQASDLKSVKSYSVRWERMDFRYHLYVLNLNQKPELQLCEREHQDFLWCEAKVALDLNLVPDAEPILRELFNL